MPQRDPAPPPLARALRHREEPAVNHFIEAVRCVGAAPRREGLRCPGLRSHADRHVETVVLHELLAEEGVVVTPTPHVADHGVRDEVADPDAMARNLTSIAAGQLCGGAVHLVR